MTGRNREVAERIGALEAVALHVRRGDYVTDEKTRAYHGVCDAAYYARAEELVTRGLTAPHFFVFSDEPEWVARHLHLRHPATYLGHNGAAAHEDLRLMSLCKHHVIANSTWAALIPAVRASNTGTVGPLIISRETIP